MPSIWSWWAAHTRHCPTKNSSRACYFDLQNTAGMRRHRVEWQVWPRAVSDTNHCPWIGSSCLWWKSRPCAAPACRASPTSGRRSPTAGRRGGWRTWCTDRRLEWLTFASRKCAGDWGLWSGGRAFLRPEWSQPVRNLVAQTRLSPAAPLRPKNKNIKAFEV